jgi:hypothetical protein
VEIKEQIYYNEEFKGKEKTWKPWIKNYRIWNKYALSKDTLSNSPLPTFEIDNYVVLILGAAV